jgi:zinc/manganese transport system permease protein
MMLDLYHFLSAPFRDFSFMTRALWGCLLLSFSSTPVGAFLSLRKMSLTGDAMSHAILPGAAMGFMISGLSVTAMAAGGTFAGCLVALLAGFVARYSRLDENASMASFYLISLATGVLMISSSGNNIDLLHILFGSPLALDNDTLLLETSITTVTLFALAILYRPLVLECVDPLFFKTISRQGALAHYGFSLLLVLNLVSGFAALGTLMAVALMILPANIARLWSKHLGMLIFLAALAAISASFIGLLISYYQGLATSASIVLVLGVFYLISIFFAPQSFLFHRFLLRKDYA